MAMTSLPAPGRRVSARAVMKVVIGGLLGSLLLACLLFPRTMVIGTYSLVVIGGILLIVVGNLVLFRQGPALAAKDYPRFMQAFLFRVSLLTGSRLTRVRRIVSHILLTASLLLTWPVFLVRGIQAAVRTLRKRRKWDPTWWELYVGRLSSVEDSSIGVFVLLLVLLLSDLHLGHGVLITFFTYALAASLLLRMTGFLVSAVSLKDMILNEPGSPRWKFVRIGILDTLSVLTVTTLIDYQGKVLTGPDVMAAAVANTKHIMLLKDIEWGALLSALDKAFAAQSLLPLETYLAGMQHFATIKTVFYVLLDLSILRGVLGIWSLQRDEQHVCVAAMQALRTHEAAIAGKQLAAAKNLSGKGLQVRGGLELLDGRFADSMRSMAASVAARGGEAGPEESLFRMDSMLFVLRPPLPIVEKYVAFLRGKPISPVAQVSLWFSAVLFLGLHHRQYDSAEDEDAWERIHACMNENGPLGAMSAAMVAGDWDTYLGLIEEIGKEPAAPEGLWRFTIGCLEARGLVGRHSADDRERLPQCVAALSDLVSKCGTWIEAPWHILAAMKSYALLPDDIIADMGSVLGRLSEIAMARDYRSLEIDDLKASAQILESLAHAAKRAQASLPSRPG